MYVLALLHYDYNAIRNDPSIRANHYNYIAASTKDVIYLYDTGLFGGNLHVVTSSMESYDTLHVSQLHFSFSEKHVT